MTAAQKKTEKQANAVQAESVLEKNSDTLIEEEKYDSVPYQSFAYPQTHPEHLYTIGKVFNMPVPDFKSARVLELGCAAGGNLIPIAMKYPKTECVGIDISQNQIDQAQAHVEGLKLKNITFKQGDITKIDVDLGEFDYIMVHGVLSWVPEKVREAIFAVCRRHLSKNGLAVISYNTLPGWSAVRSLRDMMLYHTANFETPGEQVGQARSLLEFLHEHTASDNSSYKEIIERELNVLKKTNASYVFHDHLEVENNQFYLHEFVEMAGEQDLSYVGDTDIGSMFLGNFSGPVRKTLGQITDIVRQEQYIDFLTNRRFRHSIITKKENLKNIKRNINRDAIFDFYIEANFKTEQDDVDENGKMEFKTSGGGTFHTNKREVSCLFKQLSEEPKPEKLLKVIKKTADKYKLDQKTLKQIAESECMLFVFRKLLSLKSDTYNFTTEVSKKPKATDLARYQASLESNSSVTNAKASSVGVDKFSKILLVLLDGTRDMETLVADLETKSQNGEMTVAIDGKPVESKAAREKIIRNHVEATLKKFADLALLEA